MSGRNTQLAVLRAQRLSDVIRIASHSRDRPVVPAQLNISVDDDTSGSEFCPSSTQDSNATFEAESGEIIAPLVSLEKSRKTFDEQVTRDSLLLWMMESPDLCQQVLDNVEFRLAGWCKIATKNPNQSGYVRVTCLGKGGHDLVQVGIKYFQPRFANHLGPLPGSLGGR